MKRQGPTRGYRAGGRSNHDGGARAREALRFSSARGALRALLGAIGVGSIGLGACATGTSGGAPPLPIVATPIAPAPPASPEPLLQDGAPPLDAVLVERVPEGTFGPYVGAAPSGQSAAVWAARSEDGGMRWFSAVLDAKGTPLGAPRVLGEAPSEVALASVAGAADGFVALATGVSPTGTRVEALQLGPSGELRSGPTPLVHSRAEVLWVKALQVGRASVGLWATLGVGAADVEQVTLAPAGGARQASPVRVLEGAKAWQAVEFGDGVALGSVLVGASDESRALLVTFLDADGRRLGQTEVSSGAGIGDQIDMARVGDHLVVAWTQREGQNERLLLAALGSDMRLLAPPEPATGPFGRQRLQQLLPASEPRGEALLAWENIGQAPRGELRLQIARVSERGRVEPAAAWVSVSGGATGDLELELARKGRGLAALTRARPCAPDAATCTLPEPVPTYVELGPELELLASEPVRLAPESGTAADLAWGLHCTAEACSALAAVPAAPVPIYAVELRARSRRWASAAGNIDPTPPRVLELRSVQEGDALADLASARVGSGWLLASLTQFDESTPYVRRKTPAPDGRLAPLRARLEVRAVSSEGRTEAAKVVSYRARSTSGVALTRLSDERALLAWTALDQLRPEVFATVLGPDGAPLGQRMLTKDAGNVSRVAAAPLARGAVVAWIADGEGEARLFAVRLNEQLVRTAPEQRLGSVGGVTDLTLARCGDEAWLASVRHVEREDVLALTRLESKTAARRGDEIVIARSSGSKLSAPVLVPQAEGAVLAWIERPLAGGGEAAGARLLELDAQGQAAGEPVRVASTANDPGALRLACNAGRCQVVLDARAPDAHVVEGFEWQPGATPSPRALLYRTGAAGTVTDPAPLALVDGALFFADPIEPSAGDGRRGRSLLRRASIGWR